MMSMRSKLMISALAAAASLVFSATVTFAQGTSGPITITTGQLHYMISPPPAGFNPLTASAATLAEYDFPARPTNPISLARWTTAMKHATHYVAPDLIATPGLGQSATSTISTFGTDITGNWAGYSVDSPNNNNISYDGVNATWTVPTVASRLLHGVMGTR